MKKKIKFIVSIATIIASVLTGVISYNKTNSKQKNDLLIENVEALSQNETSSGGYIVHHTPCVDVNKTPTGKYKAYCYWSSTANGIYHSHSCTNCSK